MQSMVLHLQNKGPALIMEMLDNRSKHQGYRGCSSTTSVNTFVKKTKKQVYLLWMKHGGGWKERVRGILTAVLSYGSIRSSAMMANASSKLRDFAKMCPG